MVAIIKLCKS